MSNYLPTTILKCKDVENLCGVGNSKAKILVKDIKEFYGISVVTYSSLCAYLGVISLK